MEEKKYTFRELNILSESVISGLEALGYIYPMPVQEKVIEPILNGQSLIVESKTGSGKTAGFGIPIIEDLDVDTTNPQVLVLTPTRELAVQVCQEIASIGRYKMIRCLPVYGKQPIKTQINQLKQRVHVVVGTPGRVADLIRRGNLKLDHIKYLVIDEADELLRRGFLTEVEGIIEQIKSNPTTLLFSATMPKEIEEVCSAYLHEALRIEIESQEEPIDAIKQTYYRVENNFKFSLLVELLKGLNPYISMVFCETRTQVDSVYGKLRKLGISCEPLHGQMPQKKRLRSIDALKEGRIQCLVTTDLAGRGIHIDALDLVINYSVPYDVENYVHRIGRTGRVGNKGQAITFVKGEEETQWQQIIDFIGYPVPEGSLSVEEELHVQNNSVMKKIKSKKIKNTKNMSSDDVQSNHKKNVHKDLGRSRGKGSRSVNIKKHEDITRIRVNIGKKKKLRPGDIMGALGSIKGIEKEDIGIIDIRDTCSYVEVFNNKGHIVFSALETISIKGKTVNAKIVSNRVKGHVE